MKIILMSQNLLRTLPRKTSSDLSTLKKFRILRINNLNMQKSFPNITSIKNINQISYMLNAFFI